MSSLNDPRQAKKIKHKLAVVLLFGLLSFIFQMSSRRQMNSQMSQPCFRETLQKLFPELDSMPHADTLGRVLETLELDTLPTAHIALVKKLIRSKKFATYLIQNCYPIAIDGTQKLVRDGQWHPAEWLDRSGGEQARHATSRNSGTPVAIIRSPTQRMGDALNALRPQRLRTKAASSLLPHWLDGYSECNSCSSRVLLAHVESANCPVAYQGLKITTSLSSVSMIFSE
ncbi:hypothetical protein BPLS_P4506 [Bathymodiolus platifrons methanotrophic gill symbiont]|uniref:transposase family protein n=1 Tax=Bathymodiolus platifrons methanotrophic gill symbiont TaxID=113268 RepID=UPI001B552EC3|nr:transposase family protein [Bathymodiolus platifrons methanotrophic gill symbiont]GFO76608.1 hypothetical protein BPLS_P4506 [Bathymodiolus platifrons methanotrophic gill symbiont]